MRKYPALVFFISLAAALIAASPAFAIISEAEAKQTWEKVAGPTGLTELPFHVKEEKSPNAWVTNGSSVTVTTGLLKVLDNRDELYCVFAHEAGHIRLDHMTSSTTRNMGLSVAAGLLGYLIGSDLGNAAVNVGANLASKGWSREQEIEADDYAVELAEAQGVDPVGMYAAISRLAKINKTGPSGFNSHPPDDRRLLHIKNKILELKPDAVFPEI